MFEETYSDPGVLKPEFVHENDQDVENLTFIDGGGTDDDV